MYRGQLAEVSRSAVSRTFTPGASVSAATRAKVLAAAEQLGYEPNRLPRMLHGDGSGIVAVVAGDLLSPFHAAALDAIVEALSATGKFVKLVRANSDQVLDDVVRDLVGCRVDAVVSPLAVRGPDAVEALDRVGVPVIRFAPGAPGKWVWTVMSDNQEIGRTAASLLINAGCRSLAFLAGLGSSAQDLRGDGFVAEARASGVEVLRLPAMGHDHAAGLAGFRMLSKVTRVDGVMCGNDLVACGLLDAERTAGTAGRLRVIGCDNIPQADWPPYRLTTFDQRVDRLAQTVSNMIDSGYPTDRVVIVPPELVRRQSA